MNGDRTVNLNLGEQRRHRRNYILNLVRERGPLSRHDIARATALSGVTVAALVQDLLDEGFLLELGPGEPSGGRPPMLVGLNSGGGCLVGVEFDATACAAALVDLEFRVVAEVRRPMARAAGRAGLIDQVLDTVREVMSGGGAGPGAPARPPTAGLRPPRLLAIGVATPGLVDTRAAVSRSYYNLPGWENVPLAELLQQEFGLPAFLDHNVRLMALAEQRFGVAQGYGDVLFLSGRAGIGLGILAGGEVYRGAGEMAGEIGHVLAEPDGPLCACGKRGCLEAVASGGAVVARVEEAIGRGVPSVLERAGRLTPEGIWRAAEAGDTLAQQELERAATYVGTALGNLVNVLNPDMIVIGEGLSGNSRLYVDRVRAVVGSVALPPARERLAIAASQLGTRAGLLGAAALAWRRSFQTYLDVPVMG